ARKPVRIEGVYLTWFKMGDGTVDLRFHVVRGLCLRVVWHALAVESRRRTVFVKDDGCLTGILGVVNVPGLLDHCKFGGAVYRDQPSGRRVNPDFALHILPVIPEQSVFHTVGGIVGQAIPGVIPEEVSRMRIHGRDSPKIMVVSVGLVRSRK